MQGGGNTIAYYGYKDGSGDFFIRLDTDKCKECVNKPCVDACPAGLLEIFVNDYDDVVVRVEEKHRRKIKYSCSVCKPVFGDRIIVCQAVCKLKAIAHTW